MVPTGSWRVGQRGSQERHGGGTEWGARAAVRPWEARLAPGAAVLTVALGGYLGHRRKWAPQKALEGSPRGRLSSVPLPLPPSLGSRQLQGLPSRLAPAQKRRGRPGPASAGLVLTDPGLPPHPAAHPPQRRHASPALPHRALCLPLHPGGEAHQAAGQPFLEQQQVPRPPLCWRGHLTQPQARGDGSTRAQLPLGEGRPQWPWSGGAPSLVRWRPLQPLLV